jgi:radical SAM superfamily enzyme YgiQ (UPF0313 family)
LELPFRNRGDELLRPGEMSRLRLRLRNLSASHDVKTVIAYAFDPRTRVLPFLYADLRMAPAGVRAIGSALADAGFHDTRIVLQQWNPNFRPSQMRLGGRIPDLFLVSSMRLHSAQCESLIRDACRIAPGERPLIIAGGPQVIYEPWTVFSADTGDRWGADVAVTGEEYVLLELLEVLLSVRAKNEPMRSAFQRARDTGALDGVAGLVYARKNAQDVTEQLVDTGIQRLLGDLDELPQPALGYRLLEPPSKLPTLAPAAIPSGMVRRHSPVGSLVFTQGCRFRCSFCPIPAYNQRQQRAKSGDRIADEIEQLFSEFDFRYFFGTDDNFFADKARALDIAGTLARKVDAGSRPHRKIRWATEATIHDTLALGEHLATVRKAGVWALWLGVEDMSGALVKKGQEADQTLEAFALLRRNGIYPIPMLMHHDAQPLVSWRGNFGLLNQLGMLRKAGALYTQVLMLTPAVGSKSYEECYSSGLAYESVDGVAVEPMMATGTYVIASQHPRPWLRQLNILAAYAYFFNPLRFFAALVFSKSRLPQAMAETTAPEAARQRPLWKRIMRRASRILGAHLGDAAIQAAGMVGLAQTTLRTIGWIRHLLRGNIRRYTAAPGSRIPMRGVDGSPASHALPGTPQAVRKTDDLNRVA